MKLDDRGYGDNQNLWLNILLGQEPNFKSEEALKYYKDELPEEEQAYQSIEQPGTEYVDASYTEENEEDESGTVMYFATVEIDVAFSINDYVVRGIAPSLVLVMDYPDHSDHIAFYNN